MTIKHQQSPLSTNDFDYVLPEELIAHEPMEQRDASRLLIVPQTENTLLDKKFADIVDVLQAGDLLILNDTKVFPARLFASKQTGGKIEILAERLLENNIFKAQIKSNRTPKVASRLVINEAIELEVIAREDEFFLLKCLSETPALEIFQRHGHVPLPPYIQREDNSQDKSRYQTVYAQNTGAVAAPTAGLHFTQELLEKLKQKGVVVDTITLHVGAGTFKPVKVDDPSRHKMHAEYAKVSTETCERIKQTKQQGGRVFAVGTTCVRALESCAHNRVFGEYSGETDIFIFPGFEFKVVDCLITNFHLPRSTLLMLISALCGREKIQWAYQHAIEQRYRFYSYGDAMLILK